MTTFSDPRRLGMTAAGVLIVAAVLDGDIAWGVDPFVTTIYLVLLAAVMIAALRPRRWSLTVATLLLFLSAFSMFQLSYHGPNGKDVQEFAKHFSGPASWTCFVIALVGAASGVASLVQLRQQSS